MDMSAYVLLRALPDSRALFCDCLQRCAKSAELRFALADLNRLLSRWSRGELQDAIEMPPLLPLAPFVANYAAALIEQACARHTMALPAWVGEIPPLQLPEFASTLPGLRMHLLTASPASFRRRNLFVDAGLGAQV
jgi:hypothetical protein